jgi:4-amino-4-deoxy-L-arabinose transferase-like glycosyltransferase
MSNETPPDSAQVDRRMLAPGIVFLSCGTSFLGVGIATKMTVFMLVAPAFIVLGIVFLVRARRRPDDRDPH